ncbi:response regulator [Legionella impletisoli]|uniref:Response regulator n=1 Tax=Legionella impletisoli TaxID=343510 RepID=A0A917JSH8_9GAMM|nr:response regulator [Legionella impletisoli]GGI81686.1 response regulator [Legionella impletisoli]
MINDTRKKILLVEDDDNDAELTMLRLQEHHIANEILRVVDGEEALMYLNRQGRYKERPSGSPAVVLLDLKLPKISGLEVLKAIRNSERLKHTPVVVLTSSKEEQDLIKSYELGVNAYVVKPVDFNQFATAIRQLGIFWLVINTPPPEQPE